MTDLPEQLEEIAKALRADATQFENNAMVLVRYVEGGHRRTRGDVAADLRLLLSERSTSMERIRELEARLEPFMREADRLDPLPRDPVVLINDNVEIWQCGDESFRRSWITYGDLRAARAALQHRDRSK